jgi:hypothetical protein
MFVCRYGCAFNSIERLHFEEHILLASRIGLIVEKCTQEIGPNVWFLGIVWTLLVPQTQCAGPGLSQACSLFRLGRIPLEYRFELLHPILRGCCFLLSPRVQETQKSGGWVIILKMWLQSSNYLLSPHSTLELLFV